MELLTTELVLNATARLFLDNTLSSLRDFLWERLNMESQRDIAISGKTYLSLHQNDTQGKLMFFDKKKSNSSNFYYLEPGLYLQLRILLTL